MDSTSSGYNPKIHHRRSIRLKGYDYSKAGLYFITICCQNRICRFGEIVVTENMPTMKLNDSGKMVNEKWLEMVERFPKIELHEYSIMPNHFHCILEILSMDKIVNTQNVGVPLVGTHFDDNETTIGRPRGYAPCGYPF
jgi:hypothetical protein